MKMKVKTILIILICFLLVGCKSEKPISRDIVIYTIEEQVNEFDYITIVKVEGVLKTEQNAAFDNLLPKTYFTVKKVANLKGENDNQIVLSKSGGYLENGKFSGVKGDLVVTDGSLEYNLLEVGKYYLVVTDEYDDSQGVYLFKELNGYDENTSHLIQNEGIDTIIKEYIEAIDELNKE